MYAFGLREEEDDGSQNYSVDFFLTFAMLMVLTTILLLWGYQNYSADFLSYLYSVLDLKTILFGFVVVIFIMLVGLKTISCLLVVFTVLMDLNKQVYFFVNFTEEMGRNETDRFVFH